jgi:hypothetical protein
MGGITLRQKDEQNQVLQKGWWGGWGKKGSGTQEGFDWVGISNHILIKIRTLNFGYAPMLFGIL